MVKQQHLRSPWENGYVESFNGKLRDELLDREIFYTLTEAKILIERWRREYNTVRPHSALGYRPPAPEAISPAPLSGLIMSPALSYYRGGKLTLRHRSHPQRIRSRGEREGRSRSRAEQPIRVQEQLLTLGEWQRPRVEI